MGFVNSSLCKKADLSNKLHSQPANHICCHSKKTPCLNFIRSIHLSPLIFILNSSQTFTLRQPHDYNKYIFDQISLSFLSFSPLQTFVRDTVIQTNDQVLFRPGDFNLTWASRLHDHAFNTYNSLKSSWQSLLEMFTNVLQISVTRVIRSAWL